MKVQKIAVTVEERMLLLNVVTELVKQASPQYRCEDVGIRVHVSLPDEMRLRALEKRLRGMKWTK